MKIDQSVQDSIQPLDQVQFERIRDKEFLPHYDLQGLKALRDRAGRERDLRELYRDRAPYELLQNADDAKARRALFVLTEDGLAFAHDGRWFTVANFRSLADGWSDKDPQQCIGHKGLGFRSVLDITPAPHLVRVDQQFFAVKFTWSLNNGHIQKAFSQDPELRTNYYNEWTQYGQLACPVMYIPGLAKKQGLGGGTAILDRLVRGHHGPQFTTMFWFPARDADIDKAALRELSPSPITSEQLGRNLLSSFLRDEVAVLLPFLVSIEQVGLYVDDRRIGLACISRDSDSKEREVTVQLELDGQSQTQSFIQMESVFDIPPHILNEATTPKAVRALQQSGAKVVLSARLENGRPVPDEQSRFHVYFPTSEGTGVGFVVHGDFYVKPDRTRLMEGSYNEWLLGKAADAAANRFLTKLLDRYPASSVFAALSPTSSSSQGAGQAFVSLFASALRKRVEPFIPTRLGTLGRDKVVLPPVIDRDGFWDSHFSDVLGSVLTNKEAFLAPEEDGKETRSFLRLAQIDELEANSLLEFIEAPAERDRSPAWWYDCYSYLAEDRDLGRLGRSHYAGRKLLPAANGAMLAVPGDRADQVVCLPPAGRAVRALLRAPKCFASVFAFLDFQLSALLQAGQDTVLAWVKDRFGIANFEAAELLPRAVRSVAPLLFAGELGLGPTELAEAWSFIKQIIELSPRTLSDEVWRDIGRFPMPAGSPARDGKLDPAALVPAFLAYWPDGFTEAGLCLSGVSDLRRIDGAFLRELIEANGAMGEDWVQFLNKVGVSAVPKRLQYRRLVAGGRDLAFETGGPGTFGTDRFSGDRQADENLAVVQVLRRQEATWRATIEQAAPCGHGLPRVLASLSLIEGLDLCAEAAAREHEQQDDAWQRRLWSLVRQLPVPSMDGIGDEAFCRGGRGGGHTVAAGSYLRRQLENYRWLPSSHGPATSSEAFVRRSSRRLISSGRADDEIGDKLLPYIVVDSVDGVARLQHLGLEELEDAASAAPAALVRALSLMGQQLSTDWGREVILGERSRWRLVRGAIQEIYRSLNQRASLVDCPPGIKFATRTREGGIEFRSSPLYYAEPGSPVEQAFLGELSLFDADRPYQDLFARLGVVRLVPDENVQEVFLAEGESLPAEALQRDIATKLAPYLLAPVLVRSDGAEQGDIAVRRLAERFEVKAATHLRASYSLADSGTSAREVEFPKFYLQRRLLPGPGAIREAHFTLYAKGRESISLLDPDLDADALGDVLALVVADDMSAELRGIFPRIASRYHQARGDRRAMEEFLYYQLGMSMEAQELAHAMISGDATERPQRIPFPPAKILASAATNATIDLPRPSQIEGKIREAVDKHTESMVTKLVTSVTAGPAGEPIGTSIPNGPGPRVTPEQAAQGRRGEEEIKRRFGLAGGWEGFTLLEDVREEGCGYDFSCAKGEQTVKLEVKTFLPNGQVFVTSGELQQAAASREDYYLVGILDSGRPESEWPTFIIADPFGVLLTKGTFDVETTLRASAAEVFDLQDG